MSAPEIMIILLLMVAIVYAYNRGYGNGWTNGRREGAFYAWLASSIGSTWEDVRKRVGV